MPFASVTPTQEKGRKGSLKLFYQCGIDSVIPIGDKGAGGLQHIELVIMIPHKLVELRGDLTGHIG